MIIRHVKDLMQESNSIPMDLVRFGMAQGTAYGVAKNKIKMIDIDTLDLLCKFFSARLGRKITTNNILEFIED